MTLGSLPCPCNGENPNCFRCWGTGMYADTSSPQPPDGAYLGSRVKPALRGLSQCEECGANVLGLTAHMQFAHGPKPPKHGLKPPKMRVESPSGNPTNSYTIYLDTPRQRFAKKVPRTQVNAEPGLHVCPVCRVSFKKLTRHFNRTGHSPSGRITKFICPKCRAEFPNATQLTSHVVGSHGLKTLNLMKAQGRMPSQQSHGNVHAAPLKHVPDSANPEPNLDAKKYWGHTFRDHGQFGSYPSHDDMDDES